MWVENITLENIKCFQAQEISFTRNDTNRRDRAKPYKWITLLGENGVGKSTLLQALALLLAGPEAAKELLPRPTGWVRNSATPGKLSATLHQEDGDLGVFGDKKIRRSFSYSYFVTGTQAVQVGTGKEKETYTEPALIEETSKILSWLRTNAFASNSQGWFAVGYGAFRRLTRVSQVLIPSLDQPKRSSNFITQFNEDSALNSFERWMVYLDYRLAKNPTDSRASQMREVGEKAITRLLPGDVKITEVTADGLIQFSVDGRKVPTVSLSDGFRSVIALAGDLIWRLIQAFPDLDDPTQASGVVLIDELDIHLHPSWQRQIAGWLQEAFPKLQFFVATHSPLVAAGGGEDALTLRLDIESGEIRITQIDDLSALDADRILRSPAFGLESTHSPATDRKIKRYHQLRRKRDHLTPEEQQDYEQLSLFMKEAQPLSIEPEPGTLEARINAFLEETLPQ
ncbi:AAA family ATPase [Leptolyngbya sp. AN02str]|uniref:AAA family ATPase n=1 Tax=Leptolyngbya sp. AN02str TaxID=3423363 RepID=UPI003D312531